jgi:hypothetical protein
MRRREGVAAGSMGVWQEESDSRKDSEITNSPTLSRPMPTRLPLKTQTLLTDSPQFREDKPLTNLTESFLKVEGQCRLKLLSRTSTPMLNSKL